MVRNSPTHDQQRSMQQECMSGVSSSCHWHVVIWVSHFISLFIIPSWSYPESMIIKVFLFSILAKSKGKIIYNSKKLYWVSSLSSLASVHVTHNTDVQRAPHRPPLHSIRIKFIGLKKGFTLENKTKLKTEIKRWRRKHKYLLKLN